MLSATNMNALLVASALHLRENNNDLVSVSGVTFKHLETAYTEDS